MESVEHLLSDLNDEQKRAVTQGEGPLLIVAGAGTGKTTVITRRIAWLIHSGKCKPEGVLALTFTEKAAGEMEERVDRLLPYGYVNLWISTFHAFCQRILERHGLDIGIPNVFKLLDTTAAWLLVRKNLDRFDLDYYRPRGNPTKFIHALLQHFSRAKDEGIMPEDYLRYAQGLRLSTDTDTGKWGQAPFVGQMEPDPIFKDDVRRSHEIANAYHTYQQLLLEHGCLDFGDLLVYTRELFMNRPAILEQYRCQFKVILVDEFQDTNWIQYDLVKLLASPSNNLTVMADDDQAIFLWRGASYHNILQFKKDYPHSKEIFLTQNYRSCQNILDCAYQFIQHNNPDRLECQLAEKGGLSKQLRATHDRLGSIEHVPCATNEEEAAFVCQKIIELKNDGLSWSDVAILVRANDTARPFIEALHEMGVPYHVVSPKGLYTKPAIIDILAYCTLLIRPHDSPALWRVLSWPFHTISHSGAVALSHYAHRASTSLYDACQKADMIAELSADDRSALKMILGALERGCAKARTARATESFLAAVRDSGYLAYLKEGETQEKREALKYLDVLYKKIREITVSGVINLMIPDTVISDTVISTVISDVLDCITLEQEAGEQGSMPRADDESPDAVHILTCHSAKGLEFEHVFLVSMVERKFPTTERADAIELPDALTKETAPQGDAHLEEERRLFYVALTRAKQSVTLTSTEEHASGRKKKISRFLQEAGIMRQTEVGHTSDTWGSLRRIVSEVCPTSEKLLTLPKLPSVFSYSQLAAFQKCPLQYKYAFVLKLPVFGKASLSFGRTLHLALQRFFQQVIDNAKKDQQQLFKNKETLYTDNHQVLPTLEVLLALYDECWIDEWFGSLRQKEEYRARGREILERFYEQVATKTPRTKALEQDFTIKIQTTAGPVALKGRMDRVDLCDDGSVEIIDYKTGTPKETLTREDKEQLLYYQIASGEIFGERPSTLTYYYLDDGSTISFIGSDEDIKKLRSKAATVIEQIKQSEFEATPGWHCKFCDFRDICEKRAY